MPVGKHLFLFGLLRNRTLLQANPIRFANVCLSNAMFNLKFYGTAQTQLLHKYMYSIGAFGYGDRYLTTYSHSNRMN